MADRPPRVVITGASGLIGGVLASHLGGEYRLVMVDRVPTTDRSVTIVDLGDRDGLERTFAGADAVVHLGATSDVASPWADVLASNLVGTYHVLVAAVAAGVRRVVYASSNHVVGLYERDEAPEIYGGGRVPALDHLAPARPDSLYGVSKGFGELLGRYYAEVHGLEVVCLRLGSVLASDDPTLAPAVNPSWAPGPWERRIRATWLSHRDCAELFRCALQAEVGFTIVYGVSDTPGRFWDLEEARRVLGYRPADRWPDGTG